MTARPVLALDLGGTQLRTAVALPGGMLVGRRAEPTPQAADAMVETCVHALRASREEALATGASEPIALGISAPGPLDPFTGVLIDPPNLDRKLWGFGLAPTLERELEVEACLERDTQVAALAE